MRLWDTRQLNMLTRAWHAFLAFGFYVALFFGERFIVCWDLRRFSNPKKYGTRLDNLHPTLQPMMPRSTSTFIAAVVQLRSATTFSISRGTTTAESKSATKERISLLAVSCLKLSLAVPLRHLQGGCSGLYLNA